MDGPYPHTPSPQLATVRSKVELSCTSDFMLFRIHVCVIFRVFIASDVVINFEHNL